MSDTPSFTPLVLESCSAAPGMELKERLATERIDLFLINGRRISFSAPLALEVLARVLNVVDPR